MHTPSYVGSHVTGYDNAVKALVTHLAEQTGPNCKINIAVGLLDPGDIRELKNMLNQMRVKAIILTDITGAFDAPLILPRPPFPDGGTTLGWAPLLVIWIGIGEMLPIVLIFLCSFFPVLYNTITGIRSVDSDVIEAARTIGASDRKILTTILLPLAVPNIFTGLRLEAGWNYEREMAQK